MYKALKGVMTSDIFLYQLKVSIISKGKYFVPNLDMKNFESVITSNVSWSKPNIHAEFSVLYKPRFSLTEILQFSRITSNFMWCQIWILGICYI